MDQLRATIATFYVEITMGLIGALGVLVILYIIAQIRMSKIKEKYNLLVRGVKGVNIEQLLIKAGEDINNVHIDINNIQNNLDKIETKLSFAIQKVGFVRYNAFGNMGSDLSFSIALLDSFQNGFVLTSIYGRDYTTSYAKPLKFGKSVYPLSVEEMQAIDRAIIGEYSENIS
jgi:uncharacterized membrane protein (DUF485 family)